MEKIKGLIFAVGIAGFSCYADDKGLENGKKRRIYKTENQYPLPVVKSFSGCI